MSVANPKSNLCKLSASEMVRLLRGRELKSVELVEAHIERIQEVNPAINALVVPQFEEARAAAEQADAAIARGDDLGPLHGVPVSIKEFFDVRGLPTTAGIQGKQSTCETDAPTVSSLRKAGAIILGKSNVPQLGIAIESENPVYGRSNNPLDFERSPGGSSGGEGALIASHASPLGLGSDGGGSIRIPSHFCGICGLKPTTNRLSMRGHWQFPAFPSGWSQPGPMARSVDDLELALSVLVPDSVNPRDPAVPPVPFRSSRDVDIAGLRIGYYSQDDLFVPSPAIRRAVEFPPPRALDIWELQLGQFSADGGKWMRQYLAGSAIDSKIKKTLALTRLPTVTRKGLPAILNAIGQPTLAQIMRRSQRHHLTAYGFQEQLKKQAEFRQQFFDRLDAAKIDAIVCPPFASAAMKHNSGDIVFALAYTQTYNLLGMPAGVVPITTIQSDEESDREPSKDSVVKELRRAEEGSAGLPVGVQVVSRHWREDIALAIMRRLTES